MRVLVTGGAGFIGSATTAALLEAGHQATVLDDLRSGTATRVPPAATLVRASLADLPSVEAALRSHQVEAVLHFAASIEAGESMRTPETFFANNTAATLGLLDLLVRHDVGLFVLSSTAAVYGEPTYTPIDEDHPTVPTNAYGESKLLIERALAWLARQGRISYAALRYFNATGASGGKAEAHSPETHLIPLALDAAAGRRGPLQVFGSDYPTPDGTCVRDYVHVQDLAAAHVAALHHLARQAEQGKSGTALVANLGTGQGFTVRQVLESVERVTGVPVPVVEAGRREGDPAVLVASAERARDILGWAPRITDLDDLVRDAWQARHPIAG